MYKAIAILIIYFSLKFSEAATSHAHAVIDSCLCDSVAMYECACMVH